MKNFATIGKDEQMRFIESFDRIFCDVDGVIFNLVNPIPGSLEAIKLLRKIGKRIHFVTNNSSRTSEQAISKMHACGYDMIKKEDMVFPSLVLVHYLKKIGFNKKIFVIGFEAIKIELRKAGFKVADDSPIKIEENLQVLFTILKDDPEVGAVYFDLGLNINFLDLQRAALYLGRPDVKFFLGSTDQRIPTPYDFHLLGFYSLQNALAEFHNRTDAIAFSKPHVALNEYLREYFGISDPSKVLFIGDTLKEDMGFGGTYGYQKLLVLSGLTKKEHLEDWNYPESYKPDYYVSDLKTFYEIIQNFQFY